MSLTVYLADLVHDYLPGNYIVPLNIGYMATYVQEKFRMQQDPLRALTLALDSEARFSI